MKSLQKLVLFFLTALIFTSCQKELNFDLTGQSIGTLKTDSTATVCLPSSVHGVYIQDSTLEGIGGSQYLDVQVNITQGGICEIVSDTVNGYYFNGRATLGNLGLNTVRLYGHGKPLAPGSNTFMLTYKNNNSFCMIDVVVLPSGFNPNASFTLGNNGANCLGVTLTGNYMASLPMTFNNTALVGITVSTPGIFSLTSSTENGVTFSASGTLANGNTSITLTALGTPINEGIFNYSISDGVNSCVFSVTYLPLASPAVYTLGGSPNGCTGALINGSFTEGVLLNSSSSVTINVDVTSVGSYSITSPTVNGITFVGSGIFNTTGSQAVTLMAMGTPLLAGAFNFDITGNASTCSFSVPVTAVPVNYITCKIDGVFTTFNVQATAGLSNGAGPSILSIDGRANSITNDPSISIQIIKSMGGSVVENTYDVNQAAIGIVVSCDYNDAASTNFFATTDPANQNQNPGFTVTVTTINTGRCVGTFSGVLKESTAGGTIVKDITEGVFNVPVQ
jgi:hypothetical protein